MPGIGRAGKHGIAAVYLAGEKHPVAVIRKECILQLMECPEVFRPSHPDCRTMIAVTPCDIVSVIDSAYARVIAVYPFPYLRDVTVESQRLRAELPMQSVHREAGMQGHPDVRVIHTEHPCISVPERHYSRIEYAVGIREKIPRNHWIC